MLKLAFLHREAKRISPEYDICISTYNEVDFGRKGFQYIHHPNYPPRGFLNRYEIIAGRNLLDTVSFLDRLYRWVVRKISSATVSGFRANVSAVSSSFAAELVQKAYEIDSTLLYLPFLGERNSTPIEWKDREFRFVSVGRISRDKRFLELVDLYAHLHKIYEHAGYYILGRSFDSDYEAEVVRRAREKGVPLHIVKNLSREQLNDFLEKSKFYIGPKRFEHFGLAVLEAATLGCMTFVDNSGGQTEIVTPSVLRFRTAQELGENISRLVGDPLLGSETLEQLKSDLRKFDRDNFDRILGSLLIPITGRGDVGAEPR
jgi:glycosyltransferase involved in cell wall biosynthesis